MSSREPSPDRGTDKTNQEVRQTQRRTLLVIWLRNQNISERNFADYESSNTSYRPSWKEVTTKLRMRIDQQKAIFSELLDVLDIPPANRSAVREAVRIFRMDILALRRQIYQAQPEDIITLHERYGKLADQLFKILEQCGLTRDDWDTIRNESEEPNNKVSDDEDTSDADTFDY